MPEGTVSRLNNTTTKIPQKACAILIRLSAGAAVLFLLRYTVAAFTFESEAARAMLINVHEEQRQKVPIRIGEGPALENEESLPANHGPRKKANLVQGDEGARTK